jgi:tRNA-dihydrouridine synthase B
MIRTIPYQKGSLLLAPMEGVTDDLYRQFIEKFYPDWDILFTDFLRISTVGEYKEKHFLKHYGSYTMNSPKLRNKTIFQILTSEKGYHIDSVKKIASLGIKFLDLNLGCPSQTVCKNKGGSYLLSDLNILEKILRDIRENYPYFFSVKMRLGYKNDQNFERIIELLNECGIDAITVHGRTQADLYKGSANWQKIKTAVDSSQIPIIANGDINSLERIHECFHQTNCHSIMIARGALGAPWLAEDFKKNIPLKRNFQEELGLIYNYLFSYHLFLLENNQSEFTVLKKLKNITRYPFEAYSSNSEILNMKSSLFRSMNLNDYIQNLKKLLLI